MQAHEMPVTAAYWIVDGALLGGAHPASGYQPTAERLRELVHGGVGHFFDLTEPGERGIPAYEGSLRHTAPAVHYQNRPIRDFDVAPAAALYETLDAIEAALQARRLAYLHCFAGIGRTGLVAGCLLVRRGLSPEQALDQLESRRRGTAFEATRYTFTQEQRRLVGQWQDIEARRKRG